MAGVDDRALVTDSAPAPTLPCKRGRESAVRAADGWGLGIGTYEKLGDQLDRLLRRRQADPLQMAAAQCLEAFERYREMRAALVRRDRVDLVDDDGPGGRQRAAAGFRAEQDVERLGGCDQDMRRRAAHLLALAGRRVAGAHQRADRDVGQALRPQLLADPGERRFQVLLDVVRQGFQRRDVDDLGRVAERAIEPLLHQRIDRREKGGERLAGAGRGGDQDMPAGLDRRPRLGLRRGRRGEIAREPGGDRRMKQGGEGHDTNLTAPGASAREGRRVGRRGRPLPLF